MANDVLDNLFKKLKGGKMGTTPPPSEDDGLTAEQLYQQAEKLYAEGNKDQAFVNYKKAADKGHIEAMYQTALCYDEGIGTIQDPARAVDYYKLAANQGHRSAQFNLAVNYDNGIGVAQDQAVAVEWYKKAALQGHKKAQFNLAIS